MVTRHCPFSRGFQTLPRTLANPTSPASIPQANCPWKNSSKVPRATHPLSGCCSVTPAVRASSEGSGLLDSCEKHRLDLPSSALLAKVDSSVISPALPGPGSRQPIAPTWPGRLRLPPLSDPFGVPPPPVQAGSFQGFKHSRLSGSSLPTEGPEALKDTRQDFSVPS